MKESMKELESAYTLLDSISIRGDSAEQMSAARECLRRAFAMLKEMEDKKDGGQKDK